MGLPPKVMGLPTEIVVGGAALTAFNPVLTVLLGPSILAAYAEEEAYQIGKAENLEQQKLYGSIEDILADPPPLAVPSKESQ